jgi:hypothetical protein
MLQAVETRRLHALSRKADFECYGDNEMVRRQECQRE